MSENLSDIEIARKANIQPINTIADKLNIPSDALSSYGSSIAKIDLKYISSLNEKADGKLILVTAITPTPAGEGKTTTTVGIGDGLNKIGKKATICLREPSLGPCFGMKGGAAGGGYAQVIPMENINLHFTGDMHAITSANNLLSALIDNHIHWGNDLGIDQRRIQWKRVVDMNDRALRSITAGLGGIGNGYPRMEGFDITVASEVMAIFCLATDLDDLKERLGKIIIGFTRKREPIFAHQLKAEGPMSVLLKDAIMPNLVQTLENNPAIIHGGPFANIAHGCNSVIATKTALKLSDYVVTEAGFGADLGAEKFFNIKCRKSGLKPDLVVLVATIRALKSHGGVGLKDLNHENVAAVQTGLANLDRHIENIKKFGVDVIVAINHFITDTEEETNVIKTHCEKNDVKVFTATHWSNGGEGTIDLAEEIVRICENTTTKFKTLYSDDLPIMDKIRKVAQEIYHASNVTAEKKVINQIKKFEEQGFGHLPVCFAKTQYSFSTDPTRKGAPDNHEINVREIKISNGAGFFVVICGDIMTMPGLPRVPAAENICINDDGVIDGLF